MQLIESIEIQKQDFNYLAILIISTYIVAIDLEFTSFIYPVENSVDFCTWLDEEEGSIFEFVAEVLRLTPFFTLQLKLGEYLLIALMAAGEIAKGIIYDTPIKTG